MSDAHFPLRFSLHPRILSWRQGAMPLRLCAALLGALLLAGCGGDGSAPTEPDPPAPPPQAAVASVSLDAGGSWFLTGDTVTVNAVVRGPAGQVLTGREIAFESSDSGIATVSGSGLVSVLGVGGVTISATSEGQTGSVQLQGRPGGGLRIPALARVDSIALAYLVEKDVPGLAIGVTRNERLVFLRGYGYADLPAGEVMGPDHRFRVASLSKPLAAVAILKLVEEGALEMETPVFPLLDHLTPPEGKVADSRLASIRVRDLIEHTGGWDRAQSGDWTYPPFVQQAAAELGVSPPPSAEEVLRWVMGRPLDFDPGDRYAYSNIGYSLLARVVEKVDGRNYEEFVRDEILLPAGVTRMQVGRTFLEDRLEGEVRYHDTPTVTSVFPGLGQVEAAYGQFSVEARDGQGAWVASPADYLRFLHAVDGGGHRPDVLSASSIEWINTRPSGPAQESTSSWYRGFTVVPQSNGFRWSHGGGLPGTATIVFHRPDGVSYVIFSNGHRATSADFGTLIGGTLTAVGAWPSHDLFDHHP